MKYRLLLLTLLISNMMFCQNWISSTTNTAADFFDITFTADSTGWAVTFFPPNIYKSTNYGQSWAFNHSPPASILQSITFINDSVGFAGGHTLGSAAIFKTSDKGKTWTSTSVSNGSFSNARSIVFATQNGGYAFGNNGLILETRNGGTSWKNITAPSSSHNWTGHIFGRDKLLVAADKLYRKDGLSSGWSTVFNDDAYDIDFINDSVGYAITKSSIIKTTDKGMTWKIQSNSPLSTIAANAIEAIDTNEIYIAGFDNKIYLSVDDGKTWTLDNTQKNGLLMHNIINFESDIWACGDDGQILKKKLSLVGFAEYEQAITKVSIFPNPSSGYFVIDGINANGASISLVNLQGQEIIERSNIGSRTEIDLSTYPNGIYLLKIVSGDQLETRKLIKNN